MARDPLLPQEEPLTIDGLLGPKTENNITADELLGPDPKQGDLARGIQSGVQGLKGAGGGLIALAGRGFGAKQVEDYGLGVAERAQAAAGASAKPTDSIENLQGPGDFLDFAQFQLGNALPSIAVSIFGGGVGAIAARGALKKLAADTTAGLITKTAAEQAAKKAVTASAIAGAGGASVGLETGSIFPEAVETGVDNPVLRSLAGGTAAGALDVLPLLRLGNKLGLTRELEKKAVAETLLGKAGTVAKETVQQAGLEGITEGAQTGIERVAAGQELDSPEGISAILNATAGGAIAGGVFGGAAAPFNIANQSKANQAIAADAAARQAQTEAEQVQAEAARVQAAAQVEKTAEFAQQERFRITEGDIKQAAAEAGVRPGDANKPDIQLQSDAAPADAIPFESQAADPAAAAFQALQAQRKPLEEQLTALNAELAKPKDERRSKEAIVKDVKSVSAMLADLNSKTPESVAASIGALSLDRTVPDAKQSPKTRLAQGQVLDFSQQPAPPADPQAPPSPLPLDTLQQSAQSAPGFDRSAAEVAVLPKPAAATPLEVVTSRARETKRQGTDQDKTEYFLNASSRAVDTSVKELVDQGVLKDKHSVPVGKIVKRAVEESIKAGNVKAAKQVILDGVNRALKGKIPKEDAAVFAEQIFTGIGETEQVFFSKAGLAEVAPSPDDTDLAGRFGKLDFAARRDITERVAPVVAADVLAGENFTLTPAIGGYEGAVNPSFVVTLGPGKSFEETRDAANKVGFVLGQKQIVVVDTTVTTGDGVVDFVSLQPSRDLSADEATALYQHVRGIVPEASGMTYWEGRMDFGNFSGLPAEEFRNKIEVALESFNPGYDAVIEPSAYRSELIDVKEPSDEGNKSTAGNVQVGAGTADAGRGYGVLQSRTRQFVEQEIGRAEDAAASKRAADQTEVAVNTAFRESGKQVVDYLNFILGTPKGLEIRLFDQTDENGYSGVFRAGRLKDIIELAYNAKDVLSVAAHEGFHYLETRVLNHRERTVLRRGLKPGSKLHDKLMERVRAYDALNKTSLAQEIEAVPQEARAYGFEFWKRGELQAEGPIAKVFEKLRNLLERVRNFVSGYGFQSVEDIFLAVDAGVYAKRELSSQRTVDLTTSPLYSNAALVNIEKRFADGELPYTQLLGQVGDILDREKLPSSTVRDILGTNAEALGGSIKRFYLNNLSSGMNLARNSRGYANVFNVLSVFRARKNRLISDNINLGLSKWLNGATDADADAVGKVMFERTVKGYAVGSAEYNSLVARMTPARREMFKQANDTIGNLLDQEFKADQTIYQKSLEGQPEAYAEWLENRTRQIERLKAEGYVPERRYGDFTVHVSIPKVNAKGETKKLTLFYTQFESEARARQFQSQLNQVLGVSAPELKAEFGTKYKPEVDGALSYQQFLDIGRRNGIEFTQAERESLAKALISSDSLRRNRIFRRENVPGFSEEILRVLAEFGVGLSNKVAYREFADAINASLDGKQVEARLQDGAPVIAIDDKSNLWSEEGANAGYYRNLVNQKANYVIVPEQSNEAVTGLRAAASLHFLGGSLAAGMVQLSSLAMNTSPFLSQFTGYTNAVAKTFTALKDTTLNLSSLRDLVKLKDTNVKIDAVDAVPGLRNALVQAAEDGTTLDTEIYQIMGLTRGGLLTKSRNVRRAIEFWMAPFRVTEQINRISTFTAAYKIGQENKLAGDALYKFAQGAVYNTQFRYDEVNRPSITQNPIGALLFTFKSYPIFMGEMIVALYKQKPAAANIMLLSLFAAAGVNGLPFAEDIQDLIDTISQRIFGSPFNSRRALRNTLKSASEAIVGADLSSVFLHGVVNDLTGLSFASRVGLGDLVPGTRIGTADTDYARTAQEVFGPIGSLVTGLGKGAISLSKGEFLDAARQASPLAVQNAIKGAGQFDKGFSTDSGGRKLIDVSGVEAFWQTVGFSSRGLTKAYETDRIDRQTAAYYSEVKRDFNKSIVKAAQDGDKAKLQEIAGTIKAWNRQYPREQIAINGSSIRRDLLLAGLPLNQRTLLTLPPELRTGSLTYDENGSE